MQSASAVKKHCKLPLPEFIILVVWFSILLAFNEFRIFARALPHPYVYGFEKFGLVMLISTLAFNLRYSDLTPSVRLLTRGLVSLFLFYGILYFSPEYPELVNDHNQKIYTDLFLGRILAISLAIVGFFRPSFALLIFVVLIFLCPKFSDIASRASSNGTLEDFMISNETVGISDVDTRSLVRHI